MILEQLKRQKDFFAGQLTGPRRVLWLLTFTLLCHVAHVLVYPFPKRDPLTYLHIIHSWNTADSFTQVLEKFPKFALLLFSFFPLKWMDQAGVPLYPASVVWMILLSMVSVYAFYKIILLLTGDVQKAMWCGALMAAQPMLMLYAGNLLRDTSYLMFCLLLTLSFICTIQTKKWYFMLLNGILLAMCMLSRFEAWELFVLFPVFSVFYFVQNKWGKREILQFILLAAAGFIGTALILILLAGIDNLALLYGKTKSMVISFLPDWMQVIVL